MRHLKFLLLFSLVLMLLMNGARAQDVRIVYPQEGQDVRGEITARFEGIPSGGYALVKIDGQFRQATAQDFVVLDTISDRVTFARGDGAYRLEITVLNAGGKRVGTDSVAFNVSNAKVDVGSDAVKLVHWSPQDRLGIVQRYRVFAESNANISGGAAAGGGGGGGGDDSVSYIPAPLDWQVSALMRRIVRDVGLMSGSANISTIVQEGFERQRLSEASGGVAAVDTKAPKKARRKKSSGPTAPILAPWNQDSRGNAIWSAAPETGKFFSKMIQQNGNEINATRKAASVAIADLLPTFPDVPVRPGSTWETTMSFVGDLSSRLPINVRAPITFTAYENLQTPSGESRRCAKLESRFRLPDNLAKRIAANLANKSGTAAGGAGGGAPEGGALAPAGGETEETGFTEEDIEIARTDMARVLWFDIEQRRILRAEDTIRSNFEIPVLEGEAAVGGEGEAAVIVEPTAIAYNLRVTTWMDDRVPNPTGQYLPGGAGAHARDSVNEPGLSRILRPNTAPQ
ncbi:MAG TPA: hypothetical protein VGB45_14500 [Abditibacterium sp.]|jgi:hypothetical protein